MPAPAAGLEENIKEAKESLEEDLTLLRDLAPRETLREFEREVEEVKRGFERDIENPANSLGSGDGSTNLLSSINSLSLRFGTNKRAVREIKTLRGDVEPLFRKIQLLYPNSEQDFTSSLRWLANQGTAKGHALIEDIEIDPPYRSEEIKYLFGQAKKEIFIRESRELMSFYQLSRDELAKSLESMILNERDEPFAPLPKLFVPASTGKAMIQLTETKEMIKSVYKSDEVIDWLSTPNRNFLNEKPRDVILKGKVFRILQHFIRLGEGIS